MFYLENCHTFLGRQLHFPTHSNWCQVSKTLTVAEWWVHQRAPDQWHGHPLHYDTNEAQLRLNYGQGPKVEHFEMAQKGI